MRTYSTAERRLAWVRSLINQAIETEDTKSIPASTVREGSFRVAHSLARIEAFKQVLAMFDSPMPPHFNPDVRNIYAERLSAPPLSLESGDDTEE